MSVETSRNEGMLSTQKQKIRVEGSVDIAIIKERLDVIKDYIQETKIGTKEEIKEAKASLKEEIKRDKKN